MPKIKLSTQIDELNRQLKYTQTERNELFSKIRVLEERNKVIAAENESLMQDKRWLKLLVQNFAEILSKSSIKER